VRARTGSDVEEALRPQPFAVRRKLALSGEVLLLYARVRWLMCRHDLPRVVEALRGDVEDRQEEQAAQLFGRRVGAALSRALNPLPFDSRCLMSSLVLTAMLARRGIRCTVVIGVQPAPSFQAHAWVEHRGQVLLPALDHAYERLVEL
jgi:hypothetical protein